MQWGVSGKESSQATRWKNFTLPDRGPAAREHNRHEIMMLLIKDRAAAAAEEIHTASSKCPCVLNEVTGERSLHQPIKPMPKGWLVLVLKQLINNRFDN